MQQSQPEQSQSIDFLSHFAVFEDPRQQGKVGYSLEEVQIIARRASWTITDKRNPIITGPCGIGKTWLGCALGQKACREDRTALYTRVPRLFADLEMAHGDGSFPKLFRSLTRCNLLILDDWGPDRPTASARRDLMEIVEDRYANASTLIASQMPINAWHDVIGEATLADAILDHLVHNSYRVELDGPSLRKTMAGTQIEMGTNSGESGEFFSGR